MALVVLLRGVNVGGHKTFRPAALARELEHLGAVNIGAAGTFVIRRRVSHAHLRHEIARRLPFSTEIVICQGGEVRSLISKIDFADQAARPEEVRFVSVLSGKPRSRPSIPMSLPSSADWLLKILGRDGRFVFGVYRRQMKAISCLGRLDGLFGVPVTTRNWNTVTAIAKLLDEPRGDSRHPRAL